MTGLALRPASTVMSPVRAGAAVSNALSFSRAAMRELVRGRYRIEKPRFDLDAEGRGEILYRLVGGGRHFHFFLVSTRLPEEQKSDRNFAQSWDAMGVLCQGEWSAPREAHLRGEVPKQRAGYADYDTLIYARGNRSARLFDHVVDSLAAGRQPDLGVLAPVGYILRTTAFIGNGQLGTRPFAGYEPDHPFRRPYHAQFCSAFLLREYVFDLVDHLARVRNPGAARLCRSYRRYLGLGNAAATGLVPFVVNHPHLMHRWCLAHEMALADAKRRPALPQDATTQRFAGLLEKAILHFTQGTKPDDGVFTPPQEIASELARLREPLGEFVLGGTVAGAPAPLPWIALDDWAERRLHPEAREVYNAIVLELFPDIVDAAVDAFHADERFAVDPAMTVARLRELVHRDYAWALTRHYRETPGQHFWYRSVKAPRDVRRGLRGRDEALEFETSMDTVLQVQRLADCLARTRDEARVADVVVARPDLRHIVARVQSLAGLAYAELREHWLSGDFSPFAPVRFALSFYGMEKFEAALPKSVRGTFMQGAPVAEDVAEGREGDWPYPLMPAAVDAEPLAPLPDSIHRPAPAIAVERPGLLIAPGELTRMVQTALQGHGATLGVAEDAAGLVTFMQACGRPAVRALLEQLADGRIKDRRVTGERNGGLAFLDARGASALLAAPAAFDLAFATSHADPSRPGVAVVNAASDAWLVVELALRGARHGMACLVVWPAEERIGFAMAAPDVSGPWYACSSASRPEAQRLLHSAAVPIDTVEALTARRDGFVVCLAAGSIVPPETADVNWTAEEVRARHDAWLRGGIALLRTEFDALARAGAALLVPESEEPRLLRDGADPLKVF